MRGNRRFPARKPRRPKMKLGLPDLDQSRSAVPTACVRQSRNAATDKETERGAASTFWAMLDTAYAASCSPRNTGHAAPICFSSVLESK
jgi:hypothetical protein